MYFWGGSILLSIRLHVTVYQYRNHTHTRISYIAWLRPVVSLASHYHSHTHRYCYIPVNLFLLYSSLYFTYFLGHK
ncbi:hypothetical protein GYMLUDRAFT_503693 [Collybiopsis luxurians FD-317 M1]|uniref:Uncharacterized protein n=1 Tax=Collybiopsis luxurians FD-317 M1 TaxID=944289 RepID=A0A0D0BFD8_9AGAR|nr:hypothetical protein GYMLUDRAFT_503693 [Collybiopsis luxurians FD-317 M1]